MDYRKVPLRKLPSDWPDADREYLIVASALNQILLAHAEGSQERVQAARRLASFSRGELDVKTARRYLAAARTDYLPPRNVVAKVDPQTRIAWLKLAVDIAWIDGEVTSLESRLLGELARRLFIAPESLEQLLRPADKRVPISRSSAYRQACGTLGVEPDADLKTIHLAHRTLIRRHHPDLVPEDQRGEATRRMSDINAAHRLLVNNLKTRNK